MRVIVNIQGQQETVRNLSAFDMETKRDAVKIVQKHAKAVRKNARAIVPVTPSNRKKSSGKRGDLKRSIKVKSYFDGLGAMVIPMKPKGSHRHLVEYGTGIRRQKGSGKSVGRMTAQPFMQPAKAQQEGGYNSEMGALFSHDTTV